MTQFGQRVPIDAVDSPSTEWPDTLSRATQSIRNKLESQTSTATILAVLQQNPCLLKCVSDIKSPTYGNSIDPLYLAKHEFARVSIADRIAQEFCGGVAVGAEYPVKVGKLDIVITNSRILLDDGSRMIGIEVKSGRSIDIFQLVRYLQEVDKLIVARVPMQDVVLIKRPDVAGEIDKVSTALLEKANQIINGREYKVQGPWCYGCVADCEYRKTKSTMAHVARMDGIAGFIVDVGVTIEKTIALVRKELQANDGSV